MRVQGHRREHTSTVLLPLWESRAQGLCLLPQLLNRGHLAHVSCSAPQPGCQSSGCGCGRGREHGSVWWVQATAMEESTAADCICAVTAQRKLPLWETLEVNGVEVLMEVDPSVSVSLMSRKTQQQLFSEQTLEKPTVRLTTYTAEPIFVVGKMEMQVKEVLELLRNAYPLCCSGRRP